MKKPTKKDYKNCQDPEFAHMYAMTCYIGWKTAKKNSEMFKSLKGSKNK